MSLASPLFFIGVPSQNIIRVAFGSRFAKLTSSCEHVGELLSFFCSLGMVDPCVNAVESILVEYNVQKINPSLSKHFQTCLGSV